jgi:hypothetical protein
MNERYEQLMAQAWIEFAPDAKAVTKRFAELIVRECLDIVANADMSALEGPDPEDVLYVACKQIKEHFGVEE